MQHELYCAKVCKNDGYRFSRTVGYMSKPAVEGKREGLLEMERRVNMGQQCLRTVVADDATKMGREDLPRRGELCGIDPILTTPNYIENSLLFTRDRRVMLGEWEW